MIRAPVPEARRLPKIALWRSTARLKILTGDDVPRRRCKVRIAASGIRRQTSVDGAWRQ